jgi:hypothetical protein
MVPSKELRDLGTKDAPPTVEPSANWGCLLALALVVAAWVLVLWLAL